MSSTLNAFTAMPRRQRRHGLARWWLAGLLVSCLLPSSLVSSDVFRGAERSISVCLWVPTILRAQSRWTAKRRRALKRWVRRVKRMDVLRHFLPDYLLIKRQVAAQDVLTQRGPPNALTVY
ncbi:hypothetical protein [Vreelandella populi]|uniref:Uncharacterized protein n=1 Tax=Vreelandella populi TaxID=2498858 RepID=A0A3S0ZDF8_9GAMM|nr:hypothetical protein [Halomonas populi]RUR42591.1 hypothetical protein ELY25_01480 [Halomonas populi]RUR45806.1 hypothetical protein ELY37_07285 [Halomonas populi]